MKKWQERRAKSSVSTGGKVLLTAKMFLGKEGNLHFLSPDELFKFNDHGRDEDIEEMSAFFDLVKKGYKVLPTRRKRTDQGGNLYKFQQFNRNGISDGVKVLVIGKMLEFIEGLYDNKFTIDFTYDDLIEEAEQA